MYIRFINCHWIWSLSTITNESNTGHLTAKLRTANFYSQTCHNKTSGAFKYTFLKHEENKTCWHTKTYSTAFNMLYTNTVLTNKSQNLAPLLFPLPCTLRSENYILQLMSNRDLKINMDLRNQNFDVTTLHQRNTSNIFKVYDFLRITFRCFFYGSKKIFTYK